MTWETHSVLAGAYKSRDPRSMLSHAVEVDADGNELRVRCGRVKLDSLAGRCAMDPLERPACPRCAR